LKRGKSGGGGGPVGSPPARGRGLKQSINTMAAKVDDVAPRAGAWIETGYTETGRSLKGGRPPRGGVD